MLAACGSLLQANKPTHPNETSATDRLNPSPRVPLIGYEGTLHNHTYT